MPRSNAHYDTPVKSCSSHSYYLYRRTRATRRWAAKRLCRGIGYSPNVVTPTEKKVASQTVDEISVQQVELALEIPSAMGESDPIEQGLPPTREPSSSPPKAIDNTSTTAVPSIDSLPVLVPEAMKDVYTAGLSMAMENIVLLAPVPDVTSQFHSKAVPGISISAYVERIAKYFLCSVECYVVGFIYMDRLIKFNPDLVVNKLSCHRIILVAMTLAAKFHDDNFYTNSYYGKIGGVSLKELNTLEAVFIKMINWRLNVQPDEYNLYQNMLEKAGSATT